MIEDRICEQMARAARKRRGCAQHKPGHQAPPSLCSQEHLSLGLIHPSEKKMLKIDSPEHVLIEKVMQLFRDTL
jgi:hypothetical protein